MSENRRVFIFQFKKCEKNIINFLKILQKHVSSVFLNCEYQVKAFKKGPYISIIPNNSRNKINFDSILFNSKGSDGVVRSLRVGFKNNKKSIFVRIITESNQDLMFEIFEIMPKELEKRVKKKKLETTFKKRSFCSISR